MPNVEDRWEQTVSGRRVRTGKGSVGAPATWIPTPVWT